MGFEIKNCENEEGTIILLHGYAANGENLRPLAHEWQQYFKNWNFIALDGFIKLELGYAWFELDNNNWIQGIEQSAKIN